MTYELLDSGNQQKLESFGKHLLIREAPLAIWKPLYPDLWQKASFIFSREKQKKWKSLKSAPQSWFIDYEELLIKISLTDFGHVGFFPEHAFFWDLIRKRINEQDRVLNLFAYTGGATLAAAKTKAQVVHVDASKPSLSWAKENAKKNGLENAPIRWILEDACKFLQKEVRRKSQYDAVILDPPTFGRGAKNEVFKIEKDLFPLLQNIKQVLSKKAKFVLLTCHTPGFTPLILEQLMKQIFSQNIKSDEMFLKPKKGYQIPSGSFAIWER